jgi:hypothetical protein
MFFRKLKKTAGNLQSILAIKCNCKHFNKKMKNRYYDTHTLISNMSAIYDIASLQVLNTRTCSY